MFKSMFSKYLTAFILIILTSFIMFSSIISSIIESYVKKNTEEVLVTASNAISSSIVTDNVEEVENYAFVLANMVIPPIIRINDDLDILITDETGKVVLTTLGVVADDNGVRKPIIYGDMGKVDLSGFIEKNSEDNTKYLVTQGNINGLIEEDAIICAREIITEKVLRGYVICLESIEEEDELIGVVRSSVINSSLWVMVAAVIAIYFITERITHPLRSITKASKSFAKGDFSTRVTVYGEDEVAELADSFNHMAESLANLEKMRNSFLASISHDLRTPMTAISGFIDGINSGAIPPEKQGYYLGVISDEVHRLSRLVSQLLDVSRFESGDRKFNYTSFDVAELSRIVLISLEKKIDEKNLDVEFESEMDEMPVFADKDAIHQVIYNLFHNAIKFSFEKGKFIIQISKLPAKKIQVSVFNQGQIISQEDQNMVFERFYKSDKSRGIDKNGVGLGLYISKTIIEAHGEAINVESRENYGTRFWFTLKEGEATKRKNINH